MGCFWHLTPKQARFLLDLGGKQVEIVYSESGVEKQEIANGIFVDGEIFCLSLRPIVSAEMVGKPEERFWLYDYLMGEVFREGIRMVVACVFGVYAAS